jgi:hypothetical protein
MASSEPKRRWVRVLQFTIVAVLCLLMPVAMQTGFPWYGSVIVLCSAVIIIVGQHRIFRPAVSRTASEIVCRYIPWYEGNAYFFCLLIPLMGIAMVAAGREAGYPPWFQFAGIMLLGIMALMLWSVVHVWRRSFLRISPSALTLRSGTLGSKLTEIRREDVRSITPKIVPNPVSGKSLQVEIAYHPAESGSNTVETVLLGLHLTVRPINLVNALTTWRNSAIDDPHELLDLIEYILRARSLAGVIPPPTRSALDAPPDAPPDGSHHD